MENLPGAESSGQPTSSQDARSVIPGIRRVTAWGLALNVALSALKLVVGVVGHSQALIADAVHSLSDMSTDVAVIVGVRYWSAPADQGHPYGHGRIETIVTFLIAAVLVSVGCGLAWRAVVTVGDRHLTPPEWITFWVACLSLASKELLYHWTVRVGRRLKSSALIANAWHHRSDALSSLAVAGALLGTQLLPGWGFLDHVATLVVSAFILHVAWRIGQSALAQLSDAGADREQRRAIREVALSTAGVRAVHALRTRHVGRGLQVDLHVLVDPEMSVREGHDITEHVTDRLLREGPDVIDVLLHLEPDDDKRRPPEGRVPAAPG